MINILQAQSQHSRALNDDRELKPGTKKFHVVNLLAEGRRLHCLMREITRDSCLHSTVAGLERDFGLRVEREWKTVPGWSGHETRVKIYWLPLAERSKALALLGGPQ